MSYFATVAPWGIVLVLLALLLTVPRAVERRRAKTQPVPALVPESEPRMPRDTSRPYPRPKGSRSKLNRVCPVCGTGPETGALDRKLLGWPAHRTCAEWLGDWKPLKADPLPPEQPSTSARVGPRGKFPRPAGQGSDRLSPVEWTGEEVGLGYVSPEAAGLKSLLENGVIGIDEFRERLDGSIAASFGVPPPDLGYTSWPLTLPTQ